MLMAHRVLQRGQWAATRNEITAGTVLSVGAAFRCCCRSFATRPQLCKFWAPPSGIRKLTTNVAATADSNDANRISQDVCASSHLDAAVCEYEVGVVTSVSSHGIAWARNLAGVCAGAQLTVSSGATGVAMVLLPDRVGIAILGNATSCAAVQPGSTITVTNHEFVVPCSEHQCGAVLDAEGMPRQVGDKEATAGATIDENPTALRSVDPPWRRIGFPLVDPDAIIPQERLHTGVLTVDCFSSIGRGESVVLDGDVATGKTTLALDFIVGQRELHRSASVQKARQKPVFCIYVTVGRTAAEVSRVVSLLQSQDALEYTTIVAALDTDTAASKFFAPLSGAAIAEHYRENGKHVLLIIDDLNAHAIAAQQLLGDLRPPSSDDQSGESKHSPDSGLNEELRTDISSFPYATSAAWRHHIQSVHARLLSRAGARPIDQGGGSMTILSIVERNEGLWRWFAANAVLASDLRIRMDTGLFLRGIRPAISMPRDIRHLFNREFRFSPRRWRWKFGYVMAANMLSADYTCRPELWESPSREDALCMEVVLKQPPLEPRSVSQQLVLMYAACNRSGPNDPQTETVPFDAGMRDAILEVTKEAEERGVDFRAQMLKSSMWKPPNWAAIREVEDAAKRNPVAHHKRTPLLDRLVFPFFSKKT
jgi:F-type H+-transporting ATPase subunit alpha